VHRYGPLSSILSQLGLLYLSRNYYRHVILPKDLAKTLPKSRLLTESEWRGIGVQQSRGWQHYAIHRPEPHILLFRRVRLVIVDTTRVALPCR